MKKLGLILMATAFLLGSGFFKKNEDGSYATDTESLKKQASEATAQAGEMSAKAVEKAKKAAAKYEIKPEEIIADLDKSLADIKQKVAAMDSAEVVAYVNQYASVFSENQDKVAELTAKVKDLGFKDKFSAKGKDLKSQLATYSDQFTGLKEQCKVYLDKLNSYGVDPATFGIDLSAYGL